MFNKRKHRCIQKIGTPDTVHFIQTHPICIITISDQCFTNILHRCNLKPRAKNETAWYGLKKLHQCTYKTPHTRTRLNKKKIMSKKFHFSLFSATEISSTSATYPCLRHPDIVSPIAPISRTAVVNYPPISIFNFAKRWEYLLLQILKTICLLDGQIYSYFSCFSIIKTFSGLEL